MNVPFVSPISFPTTWGLTPVQLHDRFWIAQKVHVVRRGQYAPAADDARYFLLLDDNALILARLEDLLPGGIWPPPPLQILRLLAHRNTQYRELFLTDDHGAFRGFKRDYGGESDPPLHVALTQDSQLAHFWQRSTDRRSAWRHLYQSLIDKPASVHALSYNRLIPAHLTQMVRHLISLWPSPHLAVANLRPLSPNVWAHQDSHIDPLARFVGPVWIGAGRSLGPEASVLGPAVLWDDPDHRPTPAPSHPRTSLLPPPFPKCKPPRRLGKRLFDIAVSLAAIAFTLPLYPPIILAIWLEDGRPFFFGHRRQTLGGRSFSCLKFRSMSKNADHIKKALTTVNQADGPQFYIANDPRLTRVGRFLRRCNLDELPQFFNVLLGHMSLVGPRPSPHRENQYCPAWREARLSVRPGITGLWQICRTRQPGLDFQEWIKYDTQYVLHASWKLDLWILWKTALMILLHD